MDCGQANGLCGALQADGSAEFARPHAGPDQGYAVGLQHSGTDRLDCPGG